MPFITINHQALYFTLRRSQRAKRLQIIMRQQHFEVVSPVKISNHEVIAFVWHHHPWMLKAKRKQRPLSAYQFSWPKEFLGQEQIPFRASALCLNVKFGLVQEMRLHQNSLRVVLPWKKIDCTKLSDNVKKQVTLWYQQEAMKIIQATIDDYAPQLGCWPNGFQLKKQKTRWGSCGINQKIYLNWLLILAPPGVLEYVVVHELCHLLHRNHGKRFWAKVAQCLPEYEKQDKWLSQHGHVLLSLP